MSQNTISFGLIRFDQRELIESELAETDVECRTIFQPPGPGFFAGAVLVAIAFVTKPLFEAFLREAGKDAYLWLKSKLAFKKASRKDALTVAYHITVDGVLYYDQPDQYSETRHNNMIRAIETVLKHLPADATSGRVSVYLELDDQKLVYSRATVFPIEKQELPMWILPPDASFIKAPLLVYEFAKDQKDDS